MKAIALGMMVFLTGCQIVATTYVPPPPKLTADYSVCDKYSYFTEREACRRGVEQAVRNEVNNRQREAYRSGYSNQSNKPEQ